MTIGLLSYHQEIASLNHCDAIAKTKLAILNGQLLNGGGHTHSLCTLHQLILLVTIEGIL